MFAVQPGVIRRISHPSEAKLKEAERAWFEELGGEEGAAWRDVDWATLLFSAKECIYKCYYPLARTRLGFRDIEVEIDPARASFRAKLVAVDAPAAAGVRSFEGRLGWSEQYVFTGMTLRAPQAGAA